VLCIKNTFRMSEVIHTPCMVKMRSNGFTGCPFPISVHMLLEGLCTQLADPSSAFGVGGRRGTQVFHQVPPRSQS
ncbi:hypothetical protein L873DRAFT_1808717, partial [Choiromyces venosus 120613-1]